MIFLHNDAHIDYFIQKKHHNILNIIVFPETRTTTNRCALNFAL